jgi:hypothetical protein
MPKGPGKHGTDSCCRAVSMTLQTDPFRAGQRPEETASQLLKQVLFVLNLCTRLYPAAFDRVLVKVIMYTAGCCRTTHELPQLPQLLHSTVITTSCI